MEHKEYFIRASGKGDFKTYHLINAHDFSQLDMFFDMELEAENYVRKCSLDVVEYNEAEITNK